MDEAEKRPVSNTVEAGNTVLCPEGDAILVVTDPDVSTEKEFLVSSTVLCLASDYFRVLLTSDFKEGSETRQGICPRIPLRDDDPEAMEVLLSILHFQTKASYDAVEPKTIAAIAVQCDKYDCIEALRPWITVWLSGGESRKAEDLGLLLVAAYFFRASDHLQRISSMAIRQVTLETAKSWSGQVWTALLPPELQAHVLRGIQTILRRLHEILQAGEEALRRDMRGHEMDGRICM